MWKLDGQNEIWVESQQSWLIDRSKITLAAAVLAVSLSTSVQASDLLKQCDFNKNGAIDTAEMYGIKTRAEYRDADPKIKDIITKEKKCETDFSIAQKDASIAQKDASIAQKDASIVKWKEELARINNENNQLIQILAMLDPKEARKYLTDEIKKIETQLKTEKDDKKRNSLTYRLETLKTRLSDLDKKVA